jgi:uncharacterized membrane protein (Fun14 family)
MRFDWGGLSTGRKVLLAGGLLLLIDLFLDWQQVCANFGTGSICGSRSGWHGIGILVGLLTIALLAWELVGVFGVDLGDAVRNLPTALISAALAAAVALFAIIEFLTHNQARHWPAWLGLVLAIVIAVGGWLRFSESPATTTAGPATTPPPTPPA